MYNLLTFVDQKCLKYNCKGMSIASPCMPIWESTLYILMWEFYDCIKYVLWPLNWKNNIFVMCHGDSSECKISSTWFLHSKASKYVHLGVLERIEMGTALASSEEREINVFYFKFLFQAVLTKLFFNCRSLRVGITYPI